MSQLGEAASGLGLEFIDTLGDLVGGFGDKYASEAGRMETVNLVAKTKVQLALMEEERKKNQAKMISEVLKVLVYSFIGLAAVAIGLNYYKKLR